MVFAAGKGERMRPLTEHTPKPLIKVNGKPLIEYSLDKLAYLGVTHAVVNTHYKAEQLHDYLRHYTKMKITVSHEPELLETGGGLMKARPHLGNDPIFVINSDIIFVDNPKGTPTLQRLANHWQPFMDMLLLLQPKDKAIGYDGKGDFDIGARQQVLKSTDPVQPFVFAGVQIFHPRLLDGMEIKSFSLNYFFFRAIQKDSSLKGVYGLPHDGNWLHIGTPDGVQKATDFLKSHPEGTPPKEW
ncbi:MAG: nucleotidyltransferase family protein [Proteobacteria bacterium]|nr:nucleotidyltransferase family protein [Pseudomonadota bacterium]